MKLVIPLLRLEPKLRLLIPLEEVLHRDWNPHGPANAWPSIFSCKAQWLRRTVVGQVEGNRNGTKMGRGLFPSQPWILGSTFISKKAKNVFQE